MDGKRVTPEIYAGALLSFAMPDGAKEAVLQYHVEGLALGMSISGLSLLLLALWLVVRKRRLGLRARNA